MDESSVDFLDYLSFVGGVTKTSDTANNESTTESFLLSNFENTSLVKRCVDKKGDSFSGASIGHINWKDM